MPLIPIPTNDSVKQVEVPDGTDLRHEKITRADQSAGEGDDATGTEPVVEFPHDDSHKPFMTQEREKAPCGHRFRPAKIVQHRFEKDAESGVDAYAAAKMMKEAVITRLPEKGDNEGVRRCAAMSDPPCGRGVRSVLRNRLTHRRSPRDQHPRL